MKKSTKRRPKIYEKVTKRPEITKKKDQFYKINLI